MYGFFFCFMNPFLFLFLTSFVCFCIGLISAAREVASTTDQLVTSANDVAQRKVGEEHIIATAREVAGKQTTSHHIKKG